MNIELIEALDNLEKDKNIKKSVMIDAIKDSLMQACKKNYGKNDNIVVTFDEHTGDYSVYARKTVVEGPEYDTACEILPEDARMIDPHAVIGDEVTQEIRSQDFGRIVIQNARSVILQKIREEENKVVYQYYHNLEQDIVTGTVTRYVEPKNSAPDKPGSQLPNVCINLENAEAMLMNVDRIPGEKYPLGKRIKVYITSVKESTKGCKINVSRADPGLVKRLFEEEVPELKSGEVEIKEIAREPGSRTKMAVASSDPEIDPIGACVGANSSRVNAVVNEIGNEKIDIVNWDEDAAKFIENALSPARVIAVAADEESRSALVVVADDQLTLAIGRHGQNARLAARLTRYRIDIKSETQAMEEGIFDDMELPDEEDYEDYLRETRDEEDGSES